MRISLAFFILLLILLQYRLWFGDGNIIEVYRLETQLERAKAKRGELEERNMSLAAEVSDLKQGKEAIEELARSEMGMIKRGEKFYQIVESSDLETEQN